MLNLVKFFKNIFKSENKILLAINVWGGLYMCLAKTTPYDMLCDAGSRSNVSNVTKYLGVGIKYVVS